MDFVSDLLAIIGLIIGILGIAFAIYQYRRRRKDIEQIVRLSSKEKAEIHAATAEEIYSKTLRWELGTIGLLGSPDIESHAASLEDAFVSVSLSISWRSEERFAASRNRIGMEIDEEVHHLSPEEVMKRAFKQYRLLLIIGDPGSGKTTLLKYYAMSCLDKNSEKWKELGFEKGILPLYFPLRELEFDENGEPTSLLENLATWCEKRLLNISPGQFHTWLQKRTTLVLLDGLDEIVSKESRRVVCRWLNRMYIGLSNAYFVITSRATGYRKLDGIELEIPHLRADILDFSPQQQVEFINKWLRAVFLSELPPVDIYEQEWKQRQENFAHRQSNTIIEFLNLEDNKAVRELAAVPMLLQIMAFIWKNRRHLPQSRSELYDAALNYLLDYRDRHRMLWPLLRAEKARVVLKATALWMQETLMKDEVEKNQMYDYMQSILNTLAERPEAHVFCDNLRDRAGLIVDYDKDHYIFRHKSFREYLAAQQIQKESHEPGRLESIIEHFGEDWWEETLRFFISEAADTTFDRFMYLFFKSSISQQLDNHQQTLLLTLIREAPQRKINALEESLNSQRLNNNQKRYVLDCLKTIGSPEAVKAIEAFIENSKPGNANLYYGRDIVAELKPVKPGREEPTEKDRLQALPVAFRNSFEDNVEYIYIPGGEYKYSVTGRIQSVPGFYLCKYPVTNKRYRRFISFLEGSEISLLKMLPLEMFAERLLKYAKPVEGYEAYLGEKITEWQFKLRSRLDEDKKFNRDDQPVVGVSWYAARAYCLWLSCLETASREDKNFENMDIGQLAAIYRLPTEKEWEWAAGGEPEGSVRQYPWAVYKGEPNSNLANYNKNVNTTTPVGRCPEGATPQGLMEMAGNAWEWMDNYYKEGKLWYALRGGSWYDGPHNLLCTARSSGGPDYLYDVIGFRVLRTSS